MNSTQINKTPPTNQTIFIKNEPKQKKHTKVGERKPNKKEAQRSAAQALVASTIPTGISGTHIQVMGDIIVTGDQTNQCNLPSISLV